MNGDRTATVVIGLGEVGGPLHDLLSEVHNHTIGVDQAEVMVEEKVSIMHLCYPFQNIDSFLQIAMDYTSKYNPAIIVINSTVVPGTTTKLEERSGVNCVYSPVRGKHVRMHDELRRYQKFVAGSNEASVDTVVNHFKAAGIPTAKMSKPETLELAKLFETTYFGLLIAWAQDMDRFAKSCGSDYLEAAKFFGEIDYLPPKIFLPGFIGGHCVMPNIDLLSCVGRSPFLTAIQESNARITEELDGVTENKQDRLEPLKIKEVSAQSTEPDRATVANFQQRL
jgi:UDP-N-acetyl-D-mannosaminuronate dehydrogenase